MLANFSGRNEKLKAYKLLDDETEIPFRFSYYEDITQNNEAFLSSLHMSNDTVTIKVSLDLDWNVRDVILLGSDRSRYQVTQIIKKRKSISKGFLNSKVLFDYILILEA